uniref:UVH1 n=1 Tax=Arundo donax TaxID=35708 RepID=A0A0A9CMY2_ARUDO
MYSCSCKHERSSLHVTKTMPLSSSSCAFSPSPFVCSSAISCNNSLNTFHFGASSKTSSSTMPTSALTFQVSSLSAVESSFSISFPFLVLLCVDFLFFVGVPLLSVLTFVPSALTTW